MNPESPSEYFDQSEKRPQITQKSNFEFKPQESELSPGEKHSTSPFTASSDNSSTCIDPTVKETHSTKNTKPETANKVKKIGIKSANKIAKPPKKTPLKKPKAVLKKKIEAM